MPPLPIWVSKVKFPRVLPIMDITPPGKSGRRAVWWNWGYYRGIMGVEKDKLQVNRCSESKSLYRIACFSGFGRKYLSDCWPTDFRYQFVDTLSFSSSNQFTTTLILRWIGTADSAGFIIRKRPSG